MPNFCRCQPFSPGGHTKNLPPVERGGGRKGEDLLSGDDGAVVLVNAAFGQHTADAGGGVDNAVSADDGTGIEDAVAAHLHEIAQHGAHLFAAGVYALIAAADD